MRATKRSRVQEDLCAPERKTYEIIEEAGEIQHINLRDPGIIGAVGNLKARGLATVFKKHTSRFCKRKKRFVEVKESEEQFFVATPPILFPLICAFLEGNDQT